MSIEPKTPEAYLEQVQEKHTDALRRLRQTVLENLPEGYVERMNYNMLGYVVPHSLYPDGYHCSPELPLPFMNLASQKNYIALYHMGLYADKELHDWFVAEYAERVPSKLDMGKSCVRFKKPEQIPYELVAELCQKMTVEDWVKLYEGAVKR